MINFPVLVLNQNYEPLNVCRVRRAVVLLDHPQRKLTRLEIFHRDHFTCQYCGKQTSQLTLDHVTPRYRGGEHLWENVVSACIPCNRRKAGRTPKEAGMKLLHTPAPPRGDRFFYIPYRYRQSQSLWQKYLPQ
jgi:5-methylcytosine-specific restriction endonuclease McrA